MNEINKQTMRALSDMVLFPVYEERKNV